MNKASLLSCLYDISTSSVSHLKNFYENILTEKERDILPKKIILSSTSEIITYLFCIFYTC